jgi:glycosyltransferase involved in cell wall biosynthesis
MKPSICLNMIVKNEGERMERCLRSVLPHVKAVVIYDTGSTDRTKDIVREVCGQFGVEDRVVDGEFVNFSQARNAAWAAARYANTQGLIPWCQHALLMDADMELVVDDPKALFNLDAAAVSYNMMQTGGALTYANRRIVNLDVATDEIYRGVTHEYIDLPGNGAISGARFIDHADGANRKDKYVRDLALLEPEVEKDPTDSRSWFYLAQTYRDMGNRQHDAIRCYTRHIELNGWDEEVHQSMMNRALCYSSLNDVPRFISGMIEAYNFRPQRAEPLYELAKFFRERGNNAAALLFAKQGVNTPRPDDLLFVNDFIHAHGLRYEYAIAGFYDPKEKNRAFQVTDDLALDPSAPATFRWSARANLYWFNETLIRHCPSFRTREINFLPPRGYTAMNPSVEVFDGKIRCNVRCVNYKIDEQGRYMIGEKECHDAPIETRNFVLSLDGELDTLNSREIIWHRPQAKFPLVIGLEDVRLYRAQGDLWFSACVREQASNGTCQQLRGKLVHDHDDHYLLVDEWQMMSGEGAVEKNWMPKLGVDQQEFMYRLDKVYHAESGEITKHESKTFVGDISGSSQLVPFRHGWLAVTHEASSDPNTGKRTYWHRFAWFNIDGELRRLSLPFVFEDKQIEFCAGLAYHPNGDDLIISYGVRDAVAKLAVVKIEEVAQMIWKFHES